MEEKNRAVKQFIPSGSIPSDDTWYSVCCNLGDIESLQANISSWLGPRKSNEHSSKQLCIENAVNGFRQSLRTYLDLAKGDFISMSGEKLHSDLNMFLETSTSKRMNWINTTVLEQEPSPNINQCEPVYITEEQAGHLIRIPKSEIVKQIEKKLLMKFQMKLFKLIIQEC